MTVHTEETACTLPRNEKLSRVKGNGYEEKRKFVPVLEVAATNRNGRCGIDIKIDSLRGDGFLFLGCDQPRDEQVRNVNVRRR